MQQLASLAHFVRDFQHGLRIFARNPGFAAIAVLTLALGIGANTAIFTVLYNAVLQPLPYPDADRLVRVQALAVGGQRGTRVIAFSYPEYLDVVRENRSFDSLAAYARQTFTLTGTGDADRVSGEIVSPDYFRILGVAIAVGRSFNAEDDRAPGSHPVVIVSDAFWRTRLQGRPDAIGATIRLNGVALDIVGVAPAWFKGESGLAEVWIPMMMAPAVLRSDSVLTFRPEHWHEILGRLRDGVTVAQADEDVRRVVALMPDQQLSADQQMTATAVSLAQSKRDPALQSTLRILFGAVSVIVLIACVNLANLLLARGVSRQKEIAMRLSLGASRWAIVRQLLTECLTLSLASAAVGVLFATWGLRVLEVFRPDDSAAIWPAYTRELDAQAFNVPGTMWLFSLALGAITTIIFGLAPALQASRPDVQQALKAEPESWSGRHGAGRLRQALIAAQVAMVVVLLAAASLMLRSFDRLLARPLGMDPANILTFRVSLPSATYDAAAATAFFDRLAERIQALPEVESVARVRHLPIRERGTVTTARIDTEQDMHYVGYNVVDPAFFQIFRTTLVAGEVFDARADRSTPPVAVITESAARQLFGGAGALGHRITAMGLPATVVGVIKDVHYEPQRQQLSVAGDVYVSLRQRLAGGGYVTIRTRTEPPRLAPAVRKVVAELDAAVPLYELRTMDEHLAATQSSPRFTTLLLSAFAALALALAAIGIYGTLSYTVASRRREIAIRMALGADRSQVVGSVLRQGLMVCGVGLAVGLPLALAAARVMRMLLYEVGPSDPAAFAMALIVMAITAGLSCFLPARRAADADPVATLRS